MLLIALLTLAGLPVVAASGNQGGETKTSGGLESKASRAKAKKKKAPKPRAIPGLKLSHRHVNLGGAVRLRARVRPGGRRRYKVVVKGPDGEILRSRTNRRGHFRARWRPTRPGVYKLRAFAGHNARARGGAGTRRTVIVYRPAYASWYGPGFFGGRTACGQTLTSGTLGVAHKTLPCGTKVRLRHGGRKVTVRVIDRGPFIPGREYDLTWATKQKLRFGDLGTVYSSR